MIAQSVLLTAIRAAPRRQPRCHLFLRLSLIIKPQSLDSVFIDTFYDVGQTEFATDMFRENTEKLLQFALDRVEQFECKDIEKATLEIREQQQKMKELTQTLNLIEREKDSLMMALEMLKQKNYLLERNNQNLSMQAMSTMSPLLSKQEEIRFTHSSTSLIIVSCILLLLGLVLGVGATSWYNQQCIEVGKY